MLCSYIILLLNYVILFIDTNLFGFTIIKIKEIYLYKTRNLPTPNHAVPTQFLEQNGFSR